MRRGQSQFEAVGSTLSVGIWRGCRSDTLVDSSGIPFRLGAQVKTDAAQRIHARSGKVDIVREALPAGAGKERQKSAGLGLVGAAAKK